MRLNANYHTHSTLCDGTSTIRECADVAVRKGFTHLGFSGHMDDDVHMDFELYLTEVNKIRDEFKSKLEILCGVELDNLYDPRFADNVDYVIGSTHFLDVNYERPLSIDDTSDDVVLLCNEFFGGDYLKLCRAYYDIEATIADKFSCTFIGHFDLVTKFNNVLHFVDENDPRYLEPAYEAMEILVKKGIPFEVNTRQASRKKLFPGGKLLHRLHDLNGEILISSDAHNAEELDYGFNFAINEVKRYGFDHINILSLNKGKLEYEQIGI